MTEVLRTIRYALCSLVLVATASGQISWHSIDLAEAGKLEYAVNLPDGYDAQKTYPVLLALPPGPQTRQMVEAGLNRYWGAQARNAGWVVVSPVRVPRTTFYNGGERFLAPLLIKIRERFRVGQGRLHLAGASNGGKSAFRVATEYPFEFQTVTVLPGYALSTDVPLLKRLKNMRVHLFVGSEDGRWVENAKKTHAELQKLKISSTLKILEGDGHVPASLDGGGVMDHLVALHAASEKAAGDEGDIHRVLDDFNDAAAKADEDRYFGLFAPEGVFLGTDATERWNLEEFKKFAMPYFTQMDSAWIFVPQQRWVSVDPDGNSASFHERLGSRTYGHCRGTGALRKIDGRWRVTLYDLTVPVPNELMKGVVAQIRDFHDGRKPGLTTVILVRHAEKDTTPGVDDPGLTRAGEARARRLASLLGSAGISKIYSSEFRRTKATVAPLGAKLGLPTTVMPARDMAGLVRKLKGDHAGETVIVSGHSNTLPAIMNALGITERVRITDDDYDGLYFVTLGGDQPRLMRLTF